MEQTFEKRKKIIYDFICDDFYVPMKFKEIAMLLQVPKEARGDLKETILMFFLCFIGGTLGGMLS